MKHLLVLIFILGYLPAQAEIYQGVDEEGNATFSDQSQPNSQLIPTPVPNIVPSIKPEPKQAPKAVADKTPAAYYQSFSIISPANDSTAISSPGNLSISLSIEPALNIKQGDYIRLYIDNKLALSKTTSLNPVINNIDRGKHSLRAELVNKAGKPILSSNTQFHMKRFSSLHKP